ncbi:hypothetical protein PUV47_01760 [Pseudovibrio exalbescens]|uniref:hypothetical protein n=1 Tax=Pseudovibrio exalbescens TaxID=197461 RepID=UPI002365BFD8|nr:hypothetical protein [Pseudovibrio exalbescens]MDD7908629.1 hypothetical protein [Pseudovibrio exalbescens]
MTSKKAVNVQYRSFRIVSEKPINKTVFELVEESLDEVVNNITRRNDPKIRSREIQDSGIALLNRYEAVKNWSFGELVLFNTDNNVPVVIQEEGANILDLRRMELENGRHLLKGVLYCIFVDNHILYIQPPNVSQKLLENYLVWLICDVGAKLDGEIALDPKVEAGGDATDVEDISISTRKQRRSGARLEAEEIDVVEEQKADGGSSSDINTALKLADIVGLDKAKLEQLVEKSDGAELIADVTFKFRRKGKRVRFNRVDMAPILSDIEEDSLKLRGQNGEITGELTRISYKGGRVDETGGLLIPDDARRVLIEAYQHFRSNAYIDGEDLEQ